MRLPRHEMERLKILILEAKDNDAMWDICLRPPSDHDWNDLEEYAMRKRGFVRPDTRENQLFVAKLLRQIAESWSGVRDEKSGETSCNDCKYWVSVQRSDAVRCINTESKFYGKTPKSNFGCENGASNET